MALLIGGKSDSSTVFTDCLLYRLGFGWTKCSISGSVYRPVFGATLISFEKHYFIGDHSESTAVQFEGILSGGLLEDGSVARQLLCWSLRLAADGKPAISFESITSSTDTQLLVCRFGANAFLLDDKRIAVVGGIKHGDIVPQDDEVLIIATSASRLEVLAHCCLANSDIQSTVPRPLLVGTSISLTDRNQILLMGGGATVCTA
jgi:tRNA wybutosine-synthesizing protein 4